MSEEEKGTQVTGQEPAPAQNTQTQVDILYSTIVKLTGDQTIEDVKTFMSSPIVPTPTSVNQAVNKQYVDNMVISPNGSNSYAVAMAIVFGS